MADLDLREGWVAPELAEEFPHLGLLHAAVEARPGPTPAEVKARLRRLSDRMTGGRAVQLRQESVPWAYRVFFRQVGIDPDTRRTPVEQAALERMRAGGYRSSNLVDDALLIAVVETGVPVLAFDGSSVGSALGLRLAGRGELLGGSGRPLAAGQIVVADEERSLAVLFDEVARERGVDWDCERIVLAALSVKGVPRISVEEALWTAAEVLWAGQAGATL